MIICFVETESPERVFFREKLAGHDLHFCPTLDQVTPAVEALSIFINARIDEAFLALHPALRFITTRSASVDHIDLHACAERGVTVCNTPRYGDNTVAEHTFALILCLSRRIREALTANQKKHFSYESLRGFELRGKTLGVIGAGRIGLHTIRLARAFEMRVLAFDASPQPQLAEVLGFQYAEMEEVMREADILTLHVPLDAGTHHLLNERTLAMCKRGAIVINTARGRLIDTGALVAALESGQIGGAGLDVLEEERSMKQEAIHVIGQEIVRRLQSGLSAEEVHEHSSHRLAELHDLMLNNNLLARDNVIFTPHIAFNSVEAIDRINEATVENIESFLAGNPVSTISVAR